MNEQQESSREEGAKTIKGELFRVEDGNYFLKVKGGKEVRLHKDNTTRMTAEINKGDRIEAKLKDQNPALPDRSARRTE